MEKINEITYKEKRSEFIAFLYKINTFEEANDVISSLKIKHYKARHFLACLSMKDNMIIKEDGEPIKSMHLLYEKMKKNNIDDYLICIVRYYGGINLGQSRLSKVYFELGNSLLTKIDI